MSWWRFKMDIRDKMKHPTKGNLSCYNICIIILMEYHLWSSYLADGSAKTLRPQATIGTMVDAATCCLFISRCIWGSAHFCFCSSCCTDGLTTYFPPGCIVFNAADPEAGWVTDRVSETVSAWTSEGFSRSRELRLGCVLLCLNFCGVARSTWILALKGALKVVTGTAHIYYGNLKKRKLENHQKIL